MISIHHKVSAKLPRVDFSQICKEILGEDYELNLVITDAESMQEMNMQYRAKDKPTDILSFPLSEHSGEIYICPSEAEKQAPLFKRSYENFFAFLFIHGCVHLKGFDHGARMESIEAGYRKKFGV